MDSRGIIAYYSRKEVQEAITAAALEREIAVRYSDGGFGKRPDTLQFPGDVKEFAKKGATSFHISCERWNDPLALETGLNKKQLDGMRKGWDLLIDIDTALWDCAKQTAYLVVEALKFHGVKGYSVKFSGSKGFHIIVPFEAFPQEVNGTATKDLYPESLRVVSSYLGMIIEDNLRSFIQKNHTMEELSALKGKKPEEILKKGQLNPFIFVDLDTVLISSRHLFRSPYSLHEKTWLVSAPIKPESILKFEKEQAKPELVEFGDAFINRTTAANGSELIIQAFDWFKKNVPILKTELMPEKKRALV